MPLKKLTIGILFDWFESPYLKGIYSGINEAARQSGINLLVFLGGAIYSPHLHEIPRNQIYELISAPRVDGLIISTGTIGHFTDTDRISAFCKSFAPIPTVSFSQAIAGIPSVIADNESGLRSLMDHLINDHKYKTIGFIRGPDTNFEAGCRFEIYKKFLYENNLVCFPEFIYPGDYSYHSGLKAIETLCKDTNRLPEAIVAANDHMALGAIDGLKKMYKNNDHLNSVSKIGVVGFDELEINKFLSPSLTTIEQPLFDIGFKSVQIILDMHEHKIVEDVYALPTRLIKRESCGCESFISKFLFPTTLHIKTTKAGQEKDIVDLISSIITTLNGIDTITLNNRHILIITELVNSFKQSVSAHNPKFFLSSLHYLFSQEVENLEKFNFWQVVLFVIRSSLLSLKENPADNEFVQNLWFLAQADITKEVYYYYNYLNQKIKNENQVIRDLSEELLSKIDINEITDLLIREISRMDLKTYYLAVYEHLNAIDIKQSTIRCIIAFNENGKIQYNKEQAVFPVLSIFPGFIIPSDRTYSFMVEPLFWENQQIGIMACEFKEDSNSINSNVRDIFINNILKGAILIRKFQEPYFNVEREVAKRTDALSRANRILTQLYEDRIKTGDKIKLLNEELEIMVDLRTKEIELANSDLRETLDRLKKAQFQLIQSEKMAALGHLVAGIAHEINTPVGISVTASSHLERLTRETMNLFKNNKLKRSDFENFLVTSQDAASMVLSNLRRAHDLISSFKKIAVDQSSEEKRRFNVRLYIEEILLSLTPKLKKSNHTVVVQCPANIEINSYPGAFSQIITNLIMNSLIHGFDENQKGTLTITVTIEKDYLDLIYSDNGKGIPDMFKDKIFEPFFTTRRGRGGTGLGLNIIYNLVTGSLDGTIRCESEIGKRTAFFINIPVNK